MAGPFSHRHGYSAGREITVREDAPEGLRAGLLYCLQTMGMSYTHLRQLICPVLHVFPNPNNWSEIPNVRDEVIDLVRTCDWYRVYDICEAVYSGHFSPINRGNEFAQRLNELFEEYGIGWQMVHGQIVIRGPEEFERAVREATGRLEVEGFQTPKSELEEARRDLSRRPEPDITGTIQHCMAALECTARIVAGDDRATLGEIVQRRAADIGIPRPLDTAIDRMWGYSSEMARHLREGRIPCREEAELLLSMSAALINYLLQRNRQP